MIYIIGGEGFVGSAFARHVQRRGLKYVVVTRANYQELAGSSCELVINANGNSRKFLASQDPVEDFQQSVSSVMRSLFDFRFKQYVFLSSCDVYPDVKVPANNTEEAPIVGKAISNYGFHKFHAETIVRRYAPAHLIFRCGGFVGAGLKKNSIFDLLNDKPLWVNTESRYQYLHTDSAADTVFSLLDRGLVGETFNLCGDGCVSIRDVNGLLRKPRPVRYVEAGRPVEHYEISVEKIKRYVDLPTTLSSVTRYLREAGEE